MSNERVQPAVAGRLAGKCAVIVGLSRFLADDVSAALRAAGAEVVVDDSSRMASADLIVASVEASANVDPAVPLLVIGSLESLLSREVASERYDFISASPLRIDEVLLRAYRVLKTSDHRPGTSAAVVLAVDDDATTTAIVRAVVTRSGMTCHVASNGKQALESARTLSPSVIILDVNMPFVGGFEVLATLRNEPETADIPVIMLTSVQQEADVVRGFALGADDYVVKPFNPMELLARIKRLVYKN